MSRIGKKIIEIPAGVTVSLENRLIRVKGTKGELAFKLPTGIGAKMENNTISFKLNGDSARGIQALWGTARARVNNMVKGVSEGFTKELELQGVGYRAAVTGQNLILNVGYSHPVEVKGVTGITFAVEENIIRIAGADKVLVGQMAANIRAVRKPEPYKGKGIRYRGEQVRRKVGKVVGVA